MCSSNAPVRCRLRAAARRGAVALLVAIAFTASGCATYVDHLQRASNAASGGDYNQALSEVNTVLGVKSSDELPTRWSGDQPLTVLERASLQQAVARFGPASRDMSGAEARLELLDLKTDPVGTLGSYLFSDSVKTYKTPPTERLALNAINMLNFLAQGDLDGAAVEARRFQVMRDYLASVDVKADGPATLGTYLAGFIFERRGEGDRALRYYEEALSGGALESLDAPISRLARKNPYRGPKLSEVLKRSPAAKATESPRELLVVVSAGRVPHREPRRVPVGLAVGIAGTFLSGNEDFLKYGASKVVVYPDLESTPSVLGPPAVQIDGQSIRVEDLTNLGNAIRREFDDMRPKIVAAALTRMAARAAMAEGVRAGASKQGDAASAILSILFETTLVALDRPDTRSWIMLPDRVLVARVPVAPGTHSVDVDFGGRAQRQVSVDVGDSGYAAVVITEPR